MYMFSHSTSLQPGVYNHSNGHGILTFRETYQSTGGGVTSHQGCSSNTPSHFMLPDFSKIDQPATAEKITMYFMFLVGYSPGIFLCFFKKTWQNQPPTSIKPSTSKLSDKPVLQKPGYATVLWATWFAIVLLCCKTCYIFIS